MVEAYKPLYTAKQTAQILLVNVATVYELMNKGQLPYLILGKGNGSRKVRGSDLEKFIEGQKPAEPQGDTEREYGSSDFSTVQSEVVMEPEREL